MRNKVSEFSFYPEGSNEGRKTTFLFSVKFVTWTTSTFSEVDNWYSRIWLGMSSRYSVGIRNLYFTPRGYMRVENNVFCRIRLVSQWTPSKIKIVDKWYSRIWKGMSCRCAIRLLNFSFSSLESYKGREMTFLFWIL